MLTPVWRRARKGQPKRASRAKARSALSSPTHRAIDKPRQAELGSRQRPESQEPEGGDHGDEHGLHDHVATGYRPRFPAEPPRDSRADGGVEEWPEQQPDHGQKWDHE